MNTRLYDAHVVAASFYRQQLKEKPRGWAAQHLQRRGLGAVLEPESKWCVGYAPDRWSRLVDHLRRHGFDDREMISAGLAYVSGNGYLVDRFRDRIMFVAHDHELRPVGFIGRAAGNRVRYLNTRATEIYSKKRTLVGLDAQIERMRKGAIPVFVEGTMDALAVSLVGEEWAGVACCGSAITREQARIARMHSSTGTVVVALDDDMGGYRGAARSLPVLSEVFDDVRFARFSDGQDAAAVHAADPGLLPDGLRSARPLVDFAIELELAKWGNVLDHLSGQVNAVRAVAPLVARLPPARVAAEIGKLARAVHLDEQIVSYEVVAAVGQCHGLQPPRRGRRPVVDLGLDPPDYSRTP